MGMELQQSQRQTQQLMLTQAMRQSLHVLQLPLLELREYVTAAAAENPLLEVDCPEGAVALEPEREEAFEPDNPHNPEDFFGFEPGWKAGGPKRRSETPTALDAGELADGTGEESLQDVLNEQLLGLKLPRRTEELCRYLIECLNGDGYITFPMEELAREAGCTLFEAEQALYFLQSLQPAGVGARSLEECLILQLARGKDFNADTLTLVKEGLPLLARRDMAGLEKLLGATRPQAEKAAAAVAALEPLPGRGYAAGGPTHYILPDASIHRTAEGLFAELNESLEPRVKLDEENCRLLKNADDPALTAYLKTHMAAAGELMQGLENRRSTLKRILGCVLEMQEAYFMGTGPLAPMTMEQVAGRLGVNVSTVSRAVQGKYISFGGGAILLRSLFSAALPGSAGGAAVTPASVKLQLKALVEQEDPAHPYSDEALAAILAEKSVEISRRTVAKYRQELEIPSSAMRRRLARR
ncbi:MAG: RNA polymerase factor sigma-54 [Oscillospiraceae bacterium]|nr:RNA polymerase factor sigma-54 [Oscillospiraceae bacterium]